MDVVRHAGGSGGVSMTREDLLELRRILCAGHGPITRGEAEALMDLAEATAGQPVDAAYGELLARAVGNHLLGESCRAVPEVREALRRERWLDERVPLTGGVRRVFSRVLTCVISGDGFIDAGGGWLAQGAADAILDAVLGSGDVIDSAEAAWLRERLARGATTNPALASLRFFLRGEPMVEQRLAKVA